jgi:hypothetical protein
MLGILPTKEQPIAEGGVGRTTDIIPGIVNRRRNEHQRQHTRNNENKNMG